jgi:hypothetical protein
MKVIKHGKCRDGWSRECECTGKGNGGEGCGSTLLVEESDLYETEEFERDGGGITFTTFKCLVCNAETDIKVPSHVKVRRK